MLDENNTGTLPAETETDAENFAPDSDENIDATTDDSTVMDDDADDIDFEAILLSEVETKEVEPPKEQPAEETEQKTDAPEVSARLEALKTISAQLAELKESPDDTQTTRILRKLNKELVHKQAADLENLQNAFALGNPEKIKEALELNDGLYGYDTETGQPSASKFAATLVQKDESHAYQTALDILAQKTAKGGHLADAFLTDVLGIKPENLKIYQAHSRGETPEGFENTATLAKELENIPNERHEAFKRLSPKMRDIVLDGMQKYATESERIEAQKVLNLAQRDLLDAKSEADKAAAQVTELSTAIETSYNDLATEFNRSIPERLNKTLDNLVFSSDAGINATMKYGLASTMRDILDPDLQPNAKNYFTALGVEAAEVDKQFTKANQLFESIQKAMEIEANASARKQSAIAANAKNQRLDAEKRLLAVGISLAAQAARKTGAKSAKATKTVPENHVPVIENNSSPGQQMGRLTAAQVVAASKRGELVR